jgi:hypothetical protein
VAHGGRRVAGLFRVQWSGCVRHLHDLNANELELTVSLCGWLTLWLAAFLAVSLCDWLTLWLAASLAYWLSLSYITMSHTEKQQEKGLHQCFLLEANMRSCTSSSELRFL